MADLRPFSSAFMETAAPLPRGTAQVDSSALIDGDLFGLTDSSGQRPFILSLYEVTVSV